MMLHKPEEGDELSMVNMAIKCNLELHNEPRKSVSYLSDVKVFLSRINDLLSRQETRGRKLQFSSNWLFCLGKVPASQILLSRSG